MNEKSHILYISLQQTTEQNSKSRTPSRAPTTTNSVKTKSSTPGRGTTKNLFVPYEATLFVFRCNQPALMISRHAPLVVPRLETSY